jgi:uncharacterized protein
MAEAQTPTGAAESADPSMEDILASIRRILNEEESPTAAETPEADREAEPAAASPPPAVDDDDDILVLDQSMMVSEGPGPVDSPASEPMKEPVRPVVESVPPAPVHTQATLAPELVAPETAAAAASSVSSLMRTLAVGRSTQVYSGGPTLEDLVRSELRPLLKDWLDANLPPMVERLVRAEIERVVGRAIP